LSLTSGGGAWALIGATEDNIANHWAHDQGFFVGIYARTRSEELALVSGSAS
jgi:hypothetical protein